MHVNMNIGMKNYLLNVNHINSQGLDQKQLIIKNSELQEQKDSVTISPLGKTKGIIESLMKQKQRINESKSELIGRTLEKGDNIESIKSQLESFEEQIETIDEQIAQTLAEEIKEENEEQKKMAYKNKKPKTDEEVQAERLNSIVDLSSSLNQAQVVSSVKTNMDGEARVLEIEIKLDESRGGASDLKKERLADLEKQSANLSTDINEIFNNVSEEIKDNSDNESVNPENTETTKEKKSKSEKELAQNKI